MKFQGSYYYRPCEHCGTACISSQCLVNEFSCNNCFLALKADDINSDAEDFMQIFEDGIAAASNPVSKFSEAVISMESSTVLEEVPSMIIADLQKCIGPVPKKADTRVNLARDFSATKKSSKKTPKVSQKATKNINKSSFVLASSNPHSEQQVLPFVVTHGSNDGVVMSSNSTTATTIPLNVLE
jgi:hypothetical protein